MPTYQVVTDFDEEQELRELIGALRADNGKLLRGLLKKFGNAPETRALAVLLVHHPNLKDLVGH